MKKNKVLIIDDEAQMQKLLEITLQSNDYEVVQAVSGKEGMKTAGDVFPDLILLDLGLPDISGHEVLTGLRNFYTNPIIILSVQNKEEEIIKALDNGANDYLTKPFRTGELLARIRSSLRKTGSGNSIFSSEGNTLEIDFDQRVVKKNSEPVKLTATEFELLSLLAKNEGRVLTHQTLLKQVWGPGYINQNQYLRVFIGQLRKKIEREPNHPEFIVTESGVGYRFVWKEF